MFDLGIVRGLLDLKNNFSKEIENASKGMDVFSRQVSGMSGPFDAFSDDALESFEAVTKGVGLAVGAVTAFGTAVYQLASRGADVLDVKGAFEQFSGSTLQAEANLRGLRTGVQGTIDDMALMQTATHLLSTGVKMGASDFQTLGTAAAVLADRGLGSTAEMMKVISDAMVTGKTRALSMKLGVIDLGDAAENYAKTLGVEAEMLSEAGKAEAARVQVMGMLKTAVAGAGEQTKDFNDKIAFGWAQVQNWIDQIAMGVTQSDVLHAALDGLGKGFDEAFGSDQSTRIQTIVGLIEDGMILTANLGIATVEAARVIYTAWSGAETVIKGFLTVLLNVGTGMAAVVSGIADMAASIPGATDGMKQFAEDSKDATEMLGNMTRSMAEQTAEAARATVGQGEFHETLDKVGGTLFRIKDAMVAAKNNSKEYTGEVEANTEAQIANSAAVETNTKGMIDQAKARELQEKTLERISKLQEEYTDIMLKTSGTVADKQVKDILRWKDAQIDAAKDAGQATKQFYEELERTADAKLKAVGVDWDTLQQKSKQSLIEQRDIALRTYEEMSRRIGEFTRRDMQEQLMKYRELDIAVRTFGRSSVQAQQAVQDSMLVSLQSMDQFIKKTREAEAAQRALQEGASYSFEVTAENFNEVAKSFGLNIAKARELAKLGLSFAQIVGVLRGMPMPTNPGPRISGFAHGVENFEGGMAIVGEQGPELVRLPRGSSVTPNHEIGRGITLVNYWQVNGTGREVARDVLRIINEQLRTGRMLPSV